MGTKTPIVEKLNLRQGYYLMEIPTDIIYEVCLRSLEVYRAAIKTRRFHEYMSIGSRLVNLQKAHTVYIDGVYTICGRNHRVDGPAFTDRNGSEYWYQHGKLHRIGGPARTYPDGAERWFQNGKLHRIGGPAIIYSNGIEEWLQNGKLHRVDGPAVIFPNGDKRWYLNGELQTG